MKNFFHSGDLGDVIYSLPAVRALGGGFMYLHDSPRVQTMHGMTPQRFEAIAPLLESQIDIDAALYSLPSTKDNPNPGCNLNAFRDMGFDLCRTNLADLYLLANDLPTCLRNGPWLDVPRRRVRSVVFARSARYHKRNFPWRQIVKDYGADAMFIGTPAEHAAFVAEFGEVQYTHTPDLLEAAKIINGADLFIGNQSCPLAIAHGLNKVVLIEVCPACPNCLFDRPGEFTEYDYALRERSPAPLLPLQPPEVGAAGCKRGGMGRCQQGPEVARTQEQEAYSASEG